jgi:hypothetical protein
VLSLPGEDWDVELAPEINAYRVRLRVAAPQRVGKALIPGPFESNIALELQKAMEVARNSLEPA